MSIINDFSLPELFATQGGTSLQYLSQQPQRLIFTHQLVLLAVFRYFPAWPALFVATPRVAVKRVPPLSFRDK